jgi:hypothetical protein
MEEYSPVKSFKKNESALTFESTKKSIVGVDPGDYGQSIEPR